VGHQLAKHHIRDFEYMEKVKSVELEEDQGKGRSGLPRFERVEQVVPLIQNGEAGYTQYQDPLVTHYRRRFLTTKGIFDGGIQIISLITAIIFGVWAIRSYDAAVLANSMAESALKQGITALQQGTVANQLALIALCEQSEVSDCSRFVISPGVSHGSTKVLKLNRLAFRKLFYLCDGPTG
jgi:hypothetical protein